MSANNGTGPGPPVYSWREVFDLPDEENRDYVENGILSPGNVWLMVAPQASYKSMVAMNIALDLSEGKPLLGTLKVTKPLRTLYLDKEVGLMWIRERIKTMVQSDPNLIPDNLFVVSKGQPATTIALDDHHTIAPLIKALETLNPEVLILDCLNPLLRSVESEEAFKGVETTINTIALKFPQMAFILVHHMREVPREMDPLSIYNSRGSTKLTDWAATRMTMQVQQRTGGTAKMKARFYLRHGPVFEVEFWIGEDFRITSKKPEGIGSVLAGL